MALKDGVIVVAVKASHIKGAKASSSQCPIANALRAKGYTEIEVYPYGTSGYTHFRTQAGVMYFARLPKGVCTKAIKFDTEEESGTPITMKPFEFELKVKKAEPDNDF